MPRDPCNWLRYLTAHLAAGTLAAMVFTSALLATDAAGLAALATADPQGGVAVLLLAIGIWGTFGGLAVGAGIMGIDRQAEPPAPTPHSLPVAASAPAERSRQASIRIS